MATNPTGALLGRLGASGGSTVGIAHVYGAPAEPAGVTVVPVARARWGFGGRAKPHSGGLVLAPVGYIGITDRGARFRPIGDRMRPLVGSLPLGGLLAWLLGRRPRRLPR